MGFIILVPWKPVIEQRLGQQLTARMRGGGMSWEIGDHEGHQSACPPICSGRQRNAAALRSSNAHALARSKPNEDSLLD
ncbi:DUF3363 domain-containing protein [Xanthomonas arboricola]|uniref:DUF3363 domain-containing protein n=1 Tax=Xanthomonas arboricola TaxID=56448 RepID=UPI001F0B16B3|nr:DUF3363 domain-containing protein [Xanthomonas arboricola]